MKQGWITDEYGIQKHYVDDEVHSLNDKPAAISANKLNELWYRNNLCHRDGGKPAIVYKSGGFAFFENGKQLKICSCGQFAEKYCPTRRNNL